MESKKYIALCKADQDGLDLERALPGRAIQLQQILEGISFDGASGAFRVLADAGSRDPSTVGFKLENFKYSLNSSLSEYEVSRNTVGKWVPENQSWNLDLGSIRYYPGDTTIPPLMTDPVAAQPLRVSHVAKSMIYVLGGFVMALVVVLTVWVCQMFNEPCVSAAQPVVLVFGMAFFSLLFLLNSCCISPGWSSDVVASSSLCWR